MYRRESKEVCVDKTHNESELFGCFLLTSSFDPAQKGSVWKWETVSEQTPSPSHQTIAGGWSMVVLCGLGSGTSDTVQDEPGPHGLDQVCSPQACVPSVWVLKLARFSGHNVKCTVLQSWISLQCLRNFRCPQGTPGQGGAHLFQPTPLIQHIMSKVEVLRYRLLPQADGFPGGHDLGDRWRWWLPVNPTDAPGTLQSLEDQASPPEPHVFCRLLSVTRGKTEGFWRCQLWG